MRVDGHYRLTCVLVRALRCVAEKSVYLPHKEGRGQACKYLERVQVDIAGPYLLRRPEGGNM